MKNKCIILSAGEYFAENIKVEDGDLIVAADGGYNNALKARLKPDVLIGDFDSLKDLPKNIEIIRLNPIKDTTDTFEAIKYGISKGYKKFYIYFGTGKRFEHTFANIQLLMYLKKQGLEGFLFEGSRIYRVLSDEKITLNPTYKSNYISIFSLSNYSYITLKNFVYELENYKLTNDFPLGIDNEFLKEKDGYIEVLSGDILVIYEDENFN